MTTPKEPTDDQDPDYEISGTNDEKQQKIYEETARSNTARKITAIIEKEFSQEIDSKEKEVLEVQERLHKALKTLHLLRYVIITDFYNRKQCQAAQTGETKQTQIHPAIKQLIGKSPKRTYNDISVPSTSKDPRFLNGFDLPTASTSKTIEDTAVDIAKRLGAITETSSKTKESEAASAEVNSAEEGPKPRKIPRYVPPKSNLPDLPCPSRGVRHKIRKRIVVGNISKWIPPDWREDAASHKWTMYVRGSKEDADIGDFVSKVRFFLHPSYRPNDVVEVTSSPFHLSRRGWGEFPLRVQLHFRNALNKPMDIIHHLKLDRTYTGLQTLGSETIVDVWIYTSDGRAFSQENVLNSPEKSNPESSFKDGCSCTEDVNEKTDSNGPDVKVDERECNERSTDSPTMSVSSSAIEASVECEPPLKTDSVCDSLTGVEELRLYVNLDHDYLGGDSQRSNHVAEENITVDHSLDAKQLLNSSGSSGDVGKPTQKVHSNNSAETLAKCVEGTVENHNVNGDVCKIEFQGAKSAASSASERKIETSSRSLLINPIVRAETAKNGLIQTQTSFDGASQNCKTPSQTSNSEKEGQQLITPSMTAKTNLQPLQIVIPPPFEQTTGKRVLVLKNNKLISVDVATNSSSKVTETNPNTVETVCTGKAKVSINSAKSKTVLSLPAGISLLKKSVKSQSAEESRDKSAKSILRVKPLSSLLNANSNVPALKITDNHGLKNGVAVQPSSKDQSKSVGQQPAEQQEKLTKTKITLGKDKYKISSKKDAYEEVLKTIDAVKIADVESLVRFIIRRLPIVTPSASDPEYRRIHPYASVSEREFFAHNPGKQRAFEWCRARKIRRYLQKKDVPSEKLWTVKEVMIWARLHGYTPLPASFGFDASVAANGAKKLPSSVHSATASTCTEPVNFQKWLQSCRERKHRSLVEPDDGLEEDIDIECVDEKVPSRRLPSVKDEDGKANSSKTVPLELEESLVPLHNFVCATARDIGIRIGPDEIIPDVVHCAAGRLIMRAVECLVEDLVRSSLAKAWERSNGNGYPKIITVDDVRTAISSREEFDIFTNEGLGSRQPC